MGETQFSFHKAWQAHEREVGNLRLACSVLAHVPTYMAENDFDEEHQSVLREALRLAKLYGPETELTTSGLSREQVVARLSEGLGEEAT